MSTGSATYVMGDPIHCCFITYAIVCCAVKFIIIMVYVTCMSSPPFIRTFVSSLWWINVYRSASDGTGAEYSAFIDHGATWRANQTAVSAQLAHCRRYPTQCSNNVLNNEVYVATTLLITVDVASKQ